jgi:hypothetical protein
MFSTVQYLNDEFLNIVSFMAKITILFLSTTQIIKVTFYSLIVSIMLQYGIKYIHVEELKVDFIDIQFVILTLLVLAQINLIFNLILERIYNNFESLRINIKEKDKKIHQLNKDIEEMIKKLENQNIENQESIKEN